MNLLGKLFGHKAKLTPRQFYFPYFLYEEELRSILKPFGLSFEIAFNEKTQMASLMYIMKDSNLKLTVFPWQQFMIDSNGALLLWYKKENKLIISKFVLENTFDIQNFEIDISILKVGSNRIENSLKLDNFVTYLRSTKIKYEEGFYDSFGIIIVNEDMVELIPFDWFNEKGGDYGYVWPALARLDIDNNLLVGEGMRMDKFNVPINRS